VLGDFSWKAISPRFSVEIESKSESGESESESSESESESSESESESSESKSESIEPIVLTF